MPRGLHRYFDRRTGEIREDPIYADRTMSWAYNNKVGWLVTEHLLSRKFVSSLYGWAQRRRGSRRKILPFVEKLGVDLAEARKPVDEFKSFSDFITREIDPAARPIDKDPDICVAPVDGRILGYPAIKSDEEFVIKRASFDLRSFLRREELVRRYNGGSVLVCRLYLADYHHFHFPVDATAGTAETISGRYLSVTPYSQDRQVPFYAENFRMITNLESGRFGRISMVEVGSFTIGSIHQTFTPGAAIRKGDHKGWFELGASIVVLLFEPGRIRIDKDILENSAAGMETFVHLGESVGRATGVGA